MFKFGKKGITGLIFLQALNQPINPSEQRLPEEFDKVATFGLQMHFRISNESEDHLKML